MIIMFTIAIIIYIIIDDDDNNRHAVKGSNVYDDNNLTCKDRKSTRLNSSHRR